MINTVAGRARARAALSAARRLRSRRHDRALILASSLFDRAWFELQAGIEFADDETAVDTFLAASVGVSPHPLFEIDWIDPSHAFADRGLNQLVWFLGDEQVRQQSPHPFLDVARIRRELPGAADHPQGPVAAWLEQAGPHSVLPSPPDIPDVTLAQFRAIAHEALERHVEDGAPLRVRRMAPHFEDAPLALPPVTADADVPLVSVVMPTWNRAAQLRASVASVQAQSWPSWELIVVDDGSDDDSMLILEGLAAFDARVVPVAQPHGGVSRARNEGIARARGRYIAFLDSDNTWRPDFLRVMVEHLEAHDWRMAHGVLAMVRDGQPSYRMLEGTRTDLLVGNHVDLNILVAQTSLVREVGGFDEGLRRAVDYDLILKLAEHTDLHLVDYIGSDYTEATDDPHRISVREPLSWLSVVLGRHLVDWDAVAGTTPVPGRISVVLPTEGGLIHSVDWVLATAPPGRDARDEGPPPADVELVVAATRIRRSHRVILEELAAVFPHVRIRYTIADISLSLTSVLGGAVATGEHLVFVRPVNRMTYSDLCALVTPLQDETVSVVQPVVVDPSGLVVTAGAVFGRLTRPEAFLAGHPVSDARACGFLDLPAPFSPVVATTRACFVHHRGFDPFFEQALSEVDFGMRASGRTVLHPHTVATTPSKYVVRPRPFAVASTLLEQRWPTPPPGSPAAWDAAGFEVVGRRNVPIRASRSDRAPAPDERVFLQPRAVVEPLGGSSRLDVREGPPQLRWTIDLASPAGEPGERWGDTHFARSLAAGLESLGQRVAVDAREARHRDTRDLDDVLLVLRGLDTPQPRPGLLNIEWIISHPDLVTRDEVAMFDLVYAAGTSWAQERSQSWDTPIAALLQCTDPALFHPDLAEPDPDGPAVLFVGNSRKVFRTSVRAALAAGVTPTIYGSQWNRFVPAAAIAGTYVPNTALGRLYASAGVVLNDHWEDMRRDGFLSNRLFDAAACGARILSDDVTGIDEIFRGQVRTFSGDEDMARALRDVDALFPTADERRALAADVVSTHSFRARAEVLLEDAAVALRRLRDER